MPFDAGSAPDANIAHQSTELSMWLHHTLLFQVHGWRAVQGGGRGRSRPACLARAAARPLVGIGLGDAQLPAVTNFSGEYVAPLTVGNAAVLMRINLVAADVEGLRLAAANATEGGGAGLTSRTLNTPGGPATLNAAAAGTASNAGARPPAPAGVAGQAGEQVQQTRITATLSVSGEEVRAATKLLLLDNATGKEVASAPSGRLYPCRYGLPVNRGCSLTMSRLRAPSSLRPTPPWFT
eukprot:scaffold6196_cov17-Tisochrysis_lutea.AAC.1